MGCVYLARNIVNGKCYIGKTVGALEQRKCVHLCQAKKYLYNSNFHSALRKYGFENFVWMKIYESENDEKLVEKEIYFIKKYKTKSPHGYNLTNGGDGLSGHNHTEKSKKKMSNSSMGNQNAVGSIRSKEYLRKQSESHKGVHHTKETKEKMSRIRKGIPKTKEQNKKNSLANMGHFVSLETRRKLSIATKRYWARRKNESN